DVSFPGWTVRVDGVEQPLLRADRIFRAVQLAPGEHEVLFEYKPLSFRLGGLLSLLAIGLAGLALGPWGYACLGFGALALAGPVAGPLEIEPQVGLAIVLLTLGMLPGAMASTASALFMARERMEVPAAVTVLSSLVRIGLGSAALLAGWGIVGLAAVSL